MPIYLLYMPFMGMVSGLPLTGWKKELQDSFSQLPVCQTEYLQCRMVLKRAPIRERLKLIKNRHLHVNEGQN